MYTATNLLDNNDMVDFVAWLSYWVFRFLKNYFNFILCLAPYQRKKEDILKKIGGLAPIAVMNTTPTVQQVPGEGGINNVIDEKEGK